MLFVSEKLLGGSTSGCSGPASIFSTLAAFVSGRYVAAAKYVDRGRDNRMGQHGQCHPVGTVLMVVEVEVGRISRELHC